MNQFVILVISLGWIACNNSPNVTKTEQSIVYKQNTILVRCIDSVSKVSFIPDTAIGQISFLNATNIESYLGKNVMKKLDKNPYPPHVVFVSNDKKQLLTIVLHPGSVINEFSEFYIEYADSTAVNNNNIIDTKEFITESGIKLGISANELMCIKGQPHNIVTKNKTIYIYELRDLKKSAFLQKYNLPLYYAHYEFRNDTLVGFKFGFEYL